MTALIVLAAILGALIVAWVLVVLIGVALTFRSCRRAEREMDARMAAARAGVQRRYRGRW